MTKEEFCTYCNITEDQFYGKEVIKRNLDLYTITELPEGFSPHVRTYLDLSSVTKLPNGFSPKVGTWLDLTSITELPSGFSPQVGGRIFLLHLKSKVLKYLLFHPGPKRQLGFNLII